ncbi:hypothetical protein [Amycolatopsis sp. MtRt-6]|uniref:hypothetical protein n=1 Tax=Amycolatopsis sp. MtRt-6 TaxID=2792782 RepID=UPI001A90B03F|nr:hypothetical protein [Amycolatopsis sp. MtRt-6]
MTEDSPLAPGQQTPVPPRSLLARPAVTGLIGFVAGAVLVGVPWLVLSLLDGPSGGPLTAPADLGGLSRAQDAVAKLDKAKGQALIDRIGKSDRETAARVSAAYGGAGAVVQQYQDDQLLRSVQLLAVRAPSPGLVAPYQDAAALGLAAPSTELVRFGDVQCLVHHDPVRAGSTPDPDQTSVQTCQRTGPGLTVTLRSLSSEGNRDPREMAGILEEAWTILSR